MPSPDPRPPEPPPAAGRSPRGRLRPEPTSALAPSPSPLMSVPDELPREGAAGAGTKGRRQHHRHVVGDTAEELVYLSGRVPRALRDELHIRAIEEGRPVVDLLRHAIRAYLDHSPGTPR
jgi:hypothetical protein